MRFSPHDHTFQLLTYADFSFLKGDSALQYKECAIYCFDFVSEVIIRPFNVATAYSIKF